MNSTQAKPAEYLVEHRRVSAWLSPTDYAYALRTARNLNIALPARCPRNPDRGTGRHVSRQLRTALRRAALLRAAIMLRRHLCGTHRANIVAYYD